MLRGSQVLARCDEKGALKAEGGRVEVRYRPTGGRSYRASARNLEDVPGAEVMPDAHCAAATEPAASKGRGARPGTASRSKAKQNSAAPPEHEAGAVIVYADGACSGNPGPAGLGVVILDGAERRELSEFLGRATNNIAELSALLRAAQDLAGRSEPVRMYTDSKYSIGVLTQGWKAKKNPQLIAEVKAALEGLGDVRIYYVPGHAGFALNERADELAREAIGRRRPGLVVRAT